MKNLWNALVVIGVSLVGLALVAAFVFLIVFTQGVAILVLLGVGVVIGIGVIAYDIAKEMDWLK